MKNGRFAPNEECILVFLIIILHSTFYILHSSFSFLRFLIESINHVKESVGWDDIIESLGTSLCIDVATHVAEFVQNVESIEHNREVSLHHSFAQSSVPHQFVCVHCAVAIASARVHGEVGRYLHLPRQFELGGESIVEIEGVDVGESLSFGGGMLITQSSLRTERIFF